MSDITNTYAVVEAGEEHPGDILPTEQAALDRDVTVDPGASVRGSVHGASVTVEEDATVGGVVMATNDVTVDGGTVGGEVGTPGSVEATGARLNGGATGHHVSLTDCVVLGSVVGESVELTDCLVLGVVGARERLEVTESTCYTLNATGRTELSGVDLVLPQALVGSSLTMAGSVRVVGLRSDPVVLTETDHVEQEGRHYLTLAHRLLNLERVEGRLETLESTLERVLVSEDLADAPRDRLLAEFDLATA